MLSDRENVLKALREKPLKIYEIMKARQRPERGSLPVSPIEDEGRRPANIRPSMLPFRADELQFFWPQGPIDSTLGFRHCLSFGYGLTGHKSPFP